MNIITRIEIEDKKQDPDKGSKTREEDFMARSDKDRLRTIIDLEKLNRYNDEGCPACNRKFTLGEPVVLACGAWEGPSKYIHENEAVYDTKTSTYVERKCFEARRGTR